MSETDCFNLLDNEYASFKILLSYILVDSSGVKCNVSNACSYVPLPTMYLLFVKLVFH